MSQLDVRTSVTARIDVRRPDVRSRARRVHGPLSVLTFSLPLVLLDVVVSFAAGGMVYGASTVLALQVSLATGCLTVAGLYRPRFSLSVLDDLPLLLGAVTASAAGAGLLPYLWAGSGHDAFAALRNAWLVALAVVGVRVLAYAVLRYGRRRGLFAARTVVVGAGQVGARLVRWARQYPEYGMRPVGVVDVRPPAVELGVPYLGEPGQLRAIAAEHGVTDVVIAFGMVTETELVTVFRAAERMDVDVHLVPRFFEMQGRPGIPADRVFGIPLHRLRGRSSRVVAWRAKRLLDVVVASVALLVSAPLLAAVALAVRLDGGPGVIFRQERVGRDGRPFTVLKFRSLRPADETESSTTWNVEGDSRMSALGRVIRKTSLDELPQLVNILRGDMSLVGPRPERPHFVELFKERLDGYDSRHRVHTGLTGLAAVHGLRGDTSIEDRVFFDNQYIDSWSPWLDVVVLVRTVAAVIRGSHG